jgi:uncharacterized protein YaaN involved in tellurite resistance
MATEVQIETKKKRKSSRKTELLKMMDETTTEEVQVLKKELDKSVDAKEYKFTNLDKLPKITSLPSEVQNKVKELGNRLDLHDETSIMNYGSQFNEMVNSTTKKMLSEARLSNTGNESMDLLQELSEKLDNLDIEGVKKNNPIIRVIRKIPILNMLVPSIQKVLKKYDSIEKELGHIEDVMTAGVATALRDNNTLSRLFDHNKQYISQLSYMIAAGQYKMDDINALLKVIDKNPDYEEWQVLQVRNFANKLDRRLYEMKTHKVLFMQSLYQIQAIQAVNSQTTERARNIVNNVMPVVRGQMVVSVTAHNLSEFQTGLKNFDETVNTIMVKGTENVKNAMMEAAKAAEGTTITIETLEKNTETLKNAVAECKKIMEEGRAKRKESEAKLAKFEIDVDNAINGKLELEDNTALGNDYAIEE